MGYGVCTTLIDKNKFYQLTQKNRIELVSKV